MLLKIECTNEATKISIIIISTTCTPGIGQGTYRIAGKFGGAKFWRIANFW